MKLTIQKLVYGGAGVGEIEGKKIFVPFAGPGDELDVGLIRGRKAEEYCFIAG